MRRTFPLGGRWPVGPDEGASKTTYPLRRARRPRRAVGADRIRRRGGPMWPPAGARCAPLRSGATLWGRGLPAPSRHSEAPKGPWESVFFPGEYGLPRRACGPPRNDESWTGILVGRDHWARRGPPGRRALRNTHHVGRKLAPAAFLQIMSAVRYARRGAPMCAPRTGVRTHEAAQSLPPSFAPQMPPPSSEGGFFVEAFLWPPLMRGLSAVRLTGGEKTVGDRRRGVLWPPAGARCAPLRMMTHPMWCGTLDAPPVPSPHRGEGGTAAGDDG